MFRHVPFRYVLLSAKVTNKGTNSRMFSQVHFQVRPGVVFLVTTGVLAVEFIHVLMGLFVVPENPFLSEFGVAARIRANKFLVFIFIMSC